MRGWTPLRVALVSIAVALPLAILRFAVWPRGRGIEDLTDHQLADIGLSRWDVARPPFHDDDVRSSGGFR